MIVNWIYVFAITSFSVCYSLGHDGPDIANINKQDVQRYSSRIMLARTAREMHCQMMKKVNCSCDLHPAVISVGQLQICDAPVVGAWLLAVTMGIVGGALLGKLGPTVVGSLSYSLIFFPYAVMISSGLLVHCLYLVECGQQTPTEGYYHAALLDASLTSCIAVMFLYSGLVDVGLVKERSIASLCGLGLSCVAVFFLYFSQYNPPLNLYMTSIVLCCGGYLLLECVVLVGVGVCPGLVWLLCAGVCGGGSLYLLFYQSCWLCYKFGPWSLEGVWYYGADVSMFFIFMFVWSTRSNSSQVSPTGDLKKSLY